MRLPYVELIKELYPETYQQELNTIKQWLRNNPRYQLHEYPIKTNKTWVMTVKPIE